MHVWRLNGNSKLASGIKEGNNRYYNFFGVGAFDENAIHTGKSYAKEASWTSPRKRYLELNLLERIILIMIKLRRSNEVES